MSKKQTLVSHADFERMMIFSQKINIFQDGELLERNIKIVSHDENTVTGDNGDHYMKENCVFVRA